MLVSIRKNLDNLFILSEKELREMFFDVIFKTTLLNGQKISDEAKYLLGHDVNLFASQEEKELIINNCITERMKQMEMELE